MSNSYLANARCIQDTNSAFISGTSNDSNFVEIVYEFKHCDNEASCDNETDKRVFWADTQINPVLVVV